MTFLRSHCGRRCRLPFLCPLPPLLPSWQARGSLWVLTILCLGKWMNVDWLELGMIVPFPWPVVGVDVSLWHYLAEENKGQLTSLRRASQKDVPPQWTLEDKLPFFAFAHDCLRRWCLELWQPPRDMKLKCWAQGREGGWVLAWLNEQTPELPTSGLLNWDRIFSLFEVIFAGYSVSPSQRLPINAILEFSSNVILLPEVFRIWI